MTPSLLAQRFQRLPAILHMMIPISRSSLYVGLEPTPQSRKPCIKKFLSYSGDPTNCFFQTFALIC